MKKDTERLHRALRELHSQLRDETAVRWRRSLPFADELFDRHERAASLKFGRGSSIYDSALVIGDVRVGEETWIGPGVILDGSGELKIGANCSIAAGVHLYTHDTVKWALSGGKAAYERAPVTIGDCCYIGPHTVVAKGLDIGDHCLIATGSFVDESFPSHSIIAGTPAVRIGEVIAEGDDIVFHYFEGDE